MSNKTLGNLTEETHKEVVIIKANKGFKSIEQTIRFLLDNQKEEENIEQKEYIENNNKEEIKELN